MGIQFDVVGYPSVLLARLRKAAKEPLTEQNRHRTESFVRISRLNKSSVRSNATFSGLSEFMCQVFL